MKTIKQRHSVRNLIKLSLFFLFTSLFVSLGNATQESNTACYKPSTNLFFSQTAVQYGLTCGVGTDACEQLGYYGWRQSNYPRCASPCIPQWNCPAPSQNSCSPLSGGSGGRVLACTAICTAGCQLISSDLPKPPQITSVKFCSEGGTFNTYTQTCYNDCPTGQGCDQTSCTCQPLVKCADPQKPPFNPNKEVCDNNCGGVSSSLICDPQDCTCKKPKKCSNPKPLEQGEMCYDDCLDTGWICNSACTECIEPASSNI